MNNLLLEDTIFNELQFTKAWINTGIIDHESFIEIKERSLKEDGNSPEHYRWLAFRNFLKTNNDISGKVLSKISFLGKNEPDYTMGRAMRFKIIKHNNCPVELINIAIEDKDRGLSKEALKQKETLKQNLSLM